MTRSPFELSGDSYKNAIKYTVFRPIFDGKKSTLEPSQNPSTKMTSNPNSYPDIHFTSNQLTKKYLWHARSDVTSCYRFCAPVAPDKICFANLHNPGWNRIKRFPQSLVSEVESIKSSFHSTHDDADSCTGGR